MVGNDPHVPHGKATISASAPFRPSVPLSALGQQALRALQEGFLLDSLVWVSFNDQELPMQGCT